MLPRDSIIDGIVSVLKIKKLIITIIEVYMYFSSFVFCKYLPIRSFSSNRKNTKYIPHNMKFQLAPCQNPVRNHTIIMFLIHFSLDTLLPPRGI